MKPSPAESAPAEALELLEFGRLREWLAGFASFEPAKRRALALVPAADAAAARTALQALFEAKRLLETRGAWPSPPADDPAPWLEHVRRGRRLDGPALARLAMLLEAAERSARYWREAGAEAPTAAAPAADLVPLPELQAALRRALDPAGDVLDGASPALASIRGRRRQTRERILERLERHAARSGDSGGAEGEFVTQRDGRYVVSVRADRFDRSRGVVHDVSRSGAALFVEPFSVLPLNNELRELAAAEGEEVARILEALSRQVEAHADAIASGAAALAELDLLWARTRLSRAVGGATPEIAEGPRARLRLVRARHPLLWRQAGGDTDPEGARQRVVPFDLRLEAPRRLVLVSGPNMGGKTVLLKAVGLAVAMAHAGLDPCAAEGSCVPFVERLFVDIGDAQSLEQNLSTFAARLVRMDAMARGAGERALCLVDEIGAGTDPGEGAALARALLERLAERGAWGVATTHLGSLKTLAAERPEIANASMEIDAERLTPLYRLRLGVPGGSYALATARRLGLDAAVLERAERGVPQEARALERLLAELGEERRRAEGEREALAAERAELGARLAELERREREAGERLRERERRRLADVGALEAQARALLRDVRKEAEKAAGEREAEALRGLGGRVRELERAGDELRGARAGSAGPPPAVIAPGVEVRHAGLDVTGKVVEGPDEDGNVVLARGTWRITCKVSDLRAAGESAGSAAAARRPPSPGLPELESASTEVDVRGLAADEALSELDRALDRAVLAGLHEIRVVHGVGRGVLREAVVRHLSGHPQVAGQRLGGLGEGGRGVTVATLA